MNRYSPAGRVAASLIAARAVVRVSRAVGVAGVKFVQFLSTRYDVFSPSIRAEFAVERVRRSRAGGAEASIATVLPCMHGGRLSAIKTFKPRSVRELRRAATTMRWISAVLGRWPFGGRAAGTAAAVCSEIGGAFTMQSDPSHEAAMSRAAFDYCQQRQLPVTVPWVKEVTASSVTMAWCPPDDRQVWAEADAVVLIRTVFGLLLHAGVVHCDLHPGNVYKSGNIVTLVDFGFAKSLSLAERVGFARFLLAVAQCDAEEAWESIFHDGSSPSAAFGDVVARYSGQVSCRFNVADFGRELFASFRSSGRTVPLYFFYPLLSLMVLDGTLRELCPAPTDFQAIAAPLCVETLLEEV